MSDRIYENWPKSQSGRLLCSPDHPMPKDASGRWEHTNSGEVGEQESGWPSGDVITIQCADCGAKWKEELPQ